MDWLWVLLVAVRALSPSVDDQWAVRLGQLDDVRERAFASTDPRLLDRVYVPESRAADADARLIEAYQRRGGRVVDAELRVLDCRVVQAGRRVVRLRIVDQLGPARVEWQDGTSTTLPRDRPTRRDIVLERQDDTAPWRIAATRVVSGLR